MHTAVISAGELQTAKAAFRSSRLYDVILSLSLSLLKSHNKRTWQKSEKQTED